jgi:hypothetical protein
VRSSRTSGRRSYRRVRVGNGHHWVTNSRPRPPVWKVSSMLLPVAQRRKTWATSSSFKVHSSVFSVTSIGRPPRPCGPSASTLIRAAFSPIQTQLKSCIPDSSYGSPHPSASQRAWINSSLGPNFSGARRRAPPRPEDPDSPLSGRTSWGGRSLAWQRRHLFASRVRRCSRLDRRTRRGNPSRAFFPRHIGESQIEHGFEAQALWRPVE